MNYDNLLDPGANWCPVCGEPRGVCQCTDEDYSNFFDVEDDWLDEPRERITCDRCGGTGLIDDITPCPRCDGEGDKWWLR